MTLWWDNPLSAAEQRGHRDALSFGISQSGGVLRDPMHLGLDECPLRGSKCSTASFRMPRNRAAPTLPGSLRRWGRYLRHQEDHSYSEGSILAPDSRRMQARSNYGGYRVPWRLWLVSGLL